MVEYKITDKFNQDRINEILRIEQEKGLTPERLLEEAEDKKSPLHDLFEWDNSEAAHQYRLQQARILINEVKVVIESKEYYAFENVCVSAPVCSGSSESDTKAERVYKPIVEILSDADLRKQIVANALRQHKYWEEQNAKYSELTPIIKSAKKVRESIEKKWQKKKQ